MFFLSIKMKVTNIWSPVRADMLSDRFEYRETTFAVRRGKQL